MRKKETEVTEFDLLNMYVLEMERQGVNRGLVRLDIDTTLAANMAKELGVTVSLERLQRLADKCLANEWLEHKVLAGQYGQLSLTTSGQGVVRSRQLKAEA